MSELSILSDQKVSLKINVLTKQQYDDLSANGYQGQTLDQLSNEIFMTTDEDEGEGGGGESWSGKYETWTFHLEDGTTVNKKVCLYDGISPIIVGTLTYYPNY